MLVDRRGVEPRPEACKATVLPLSLAALVSSFVWQALLPACLHANPASLFHAQLSSLVGLVFGSSHLISPLVSPMGNDPNASCVSNRRSTSELETNDLCRA